MMSGQNEHTNDEQERGDGVTMTTSESNEADDTAALFRMEGLEKYFHVSDSLLDRLRPDRETKWVRAVDGVDLAVREGETLGLVGESGCGKSTLARTALRLIEPTAGHIYANGEDVTAYDSSELQSFRSEVQMIFQDPFASLNPRYTVRKTLTEPMKVHDIAGSKSERDERSGELLERVGLSAAYLDRYPHEFSGGQRQRIAIARALAVEPKLIVADEPTSALDVSVQAQIINLLYRLRDEMELSMLFISHDLSVIRQICDRVAVMYLGEIVELSPTKKLFREPHHPYTQALLSSIPVPDPTVKRERIPLEGDVPTPIDPPSGCRFHPRCPKVISPTDWSGTQKAWRRVMHIKTRVENDSIQPDAMRSQLGEERETVTNEDVIEALYTEHISGSDVADRDAVMLPESAEGTIRDTLSALVEGDQKRAVELLDESFTTVCERDEPKMLETEQAHLVHCHLYDSEQPGEPWEATSPQQTGDERANRVADTE